MAKFSKKVMGKEVGQASVYAAPHSMDGAPGVDLSNSGYGSKADNAVNSLRVSINDLATGSAAGAKTSGIKIRGTGAATKGTMARGPMA